MSPLMTTMTYWQGWGTGEERASLLPPPTTSPRATSWTVCSEEEEEGRAKRVEEGRQRRPPYPRRQSQRSLFSMTSTKEQPLLQQLLPRLPLPPLIPLLPPPLLRGGGGEVDRSWLRRRQLRRQRGIPLPLLLRGWIWTWTTGCLRGHRWQPVQQLERRRNRWQLPWFSSSSSNPWYSSNSNNNRSSNQRRYRHGYKTQQRVQQRSRHRKLQLFSSISKWSK